MPKFEIAKNIKENELWSETVAKSQKISIKDAKELIMPEYATRKAAGADFKCAQTVTIPSVWKMVANNENVVPTLVHTGIKAAINEDEVLNIYNRSSGPVKKGLILANSVGIIDADYYGNSKSDGEIMFAFLNVWQEDITINIGDAIGQGVINKIVRDEEIKRGGERIDGFGSSDKNKQ